uniref:Tail assembly chaperone n=1 Tax=viral metagenome TaxID=1070528 RepID=A0A6M3KD70_9ZZZZ
MGIIWDEIDRIALEDGDWVDIKHRMTFGDVARLENKMMKLSIDPARLKAAQATGDKDEAANAVNDIEFNTGKMELLSINVVAWSYKKQDGSGPLAVSPDNIARLDKETGELLLNAIGERNPQGKKTAGSTNA